MPFDPNAPFEIEPAAPVPFDPNAAFEAVPFDPNGAFVVAAPVAAPTPPQDPGILGELVSGWRRGRLGVEENRATSDLAAVATRQEELRQRSLAPPMPTGMDNPMARVGGPPVGGGRIVERYAPAMDDTAPLGVSPAARDAVVGQAAAERAVEARGAAAQIPQTVGSAATGAVDQTQGLLDSIRAYWNSGHMGAALANLTASSMSQQAEGMLGSVLAPAARIALSGVTSAGNEQSSYVQEALAARMQQDGLVPTPENMVATMRAMAEDGSLAEVQNRSRLRGGIIGGVDAATAGLAGAVLPERWIANPVAREAATMATQMVGQGVTGATAEALAQQVTEGKVRWGSVFLEFLGEFGGAPGEVATYGRQQVAERLGGYVEAAVRRRRAAAGGGDPNAPIAPDEVVGVAPEILAAYQAAGFSADEVRQAQAAFGFVQRMRDRAAPSTTDLRAGAPANPDAATPRMRQEMTAAGQGPEIAAVDEGTLLRQQPGDVVPGGPPQATRYTPPPVPPGQGLVVQSPGPGTVGPTAEAIGPTAPGEGAGRPADTALPPIQPDPRQGRQADLEEQQRDTAGAPQAPLHGREDEAALTPEQFEQRNQAETAMTSARVQRMRTANDEQLQALADNPAADPEDQRAARYILQQRGRGAGGQAGFDTQGAGQPGGPVREAVTLHREGDQQYPVRILRQDGTHAQVQRYDPRTGEMEPGSQPYVVSLKELSEGQYTQEPRRATDTEVRAEVGTVTQGRARGQRIDEATGLPRQTYRTTPEDSVDQNAPGAGPTGPVDRGDPRMRRADRPEQGPPPSGRTWSNAEEAARDYAERQQQQRDRQADEERRQSYQSGTSATNTPAAMVDGLYPVDANGLVVSTGGGPIIFPAPQQAARVLLNMQKNAKGQFFQIVNHPSGKGVSIQQMGVNTGEQAKASGTAGAGASRGDAGGAASSPSSPGAAPTTLRLGDRPAPSAPSDGPPTDGGAGPPPPVSAGSGTPPPSSAGPSPDGGGGTRTSGWTPTPEQTARQAEVEAALPVGTWAYRYDPQDQSATGPFQIFSITPRTDGSVTVMSLDGHDLLTRKRNAPAREGDLKANDASPGLALRDAVVDDDVVVGNAPGEQGEMLLSISENDARYLDGLSNVAREDAMVSWGKQAAKSDAPSNAAPAAGATPTFQGGTWGIELTPQQDAAVQQAITDGRITFGADGRATLPTAKDGTIHLALYDNGRTAHVTGWTEPAGDKRPGTTYVGSTMGPSKVRKALVSWLTANPPAAPSAAAPPATAKSGEAPPATATTGEAPPATATTGEDITGEAGPHPTMQRARPPKPTDPDTRPAAQDTLLICACSSSKNDAPGEIPARERYKGTLSQVNTLGPHQQPTLLIVSGKFGLIDGDTLIPAYDQALNAARTEALAEDDTTEENLHSFLEEGNFSRVIIALPKAYAEAMAPHLATASNVMPEDVRVVSGDILAQRGAVRRELDANAATAEQRREESAPASAPAPEAAPTNPQLETLRATLKHLQDTLSGTGIPEVGIAGIKQKIAATEAQIAALEEAAPASSPDPEAKAAPAAKPPSAAKAAALETIRSELAENQAERAALEAKLKTASASQRAGIVSDIAYLDERIADSEAYLARESGTTAPPPAAKPDTELSASEMTTEVRAQVADIERQKEKLEDQRDRARNVARSAWNEFGAERDNTQAARLREKALSADAKAKKLNDQIERLEAQRRALVKRPSAEPAAEAKPKRAGKKAPDADFYSFPGALFDPAAWARATAGAGAAVRHLGATIFGERSDWQQFGGTMTALGTTLRDLANAVASPVQTGKKVLDVMERVVFAQVRAAGGAMRAVARVRNSPALRGLANMLDAPPRGHRVEAVERAFNEAFRIKRNEVGKAVSGLAKRITALTAAAPRPAGTNARDHALAVQQQLAAQVRNPSARRGAMGALANDIAALLKELRDYAVAAGVEIGNVGPGYLPRMFNADGVSANVTQFLSIAEAAYRRQGVPLADAKKYAQELLESVQKGGYGIPGRSGRFTGAPSAVSERSFDAQAEKAFQAAGMYVNDIEHLLLAYRDQIVRRAEIARRFGDNWKDWQANVVEPLKKEGNGELATFAADYAETITGARPSGASHRTQNNIALFRALSGFAQLGGVAITSILEATAVGARTGRPDHAVRAVVTSLVEAGREILRLPPSQKREAAEAIGTIAGDVMTGVNAGRWGSADTTRVGLARKEGMFYRIVGQEQVTNGHYIAASQIGFSVLDQAVKALTKGGSWMMSAERARATLAEQGISAAQSAAFASWWTNIRKGGAHPQATDYATPMGQLAQTALYRFATQTIQTPDAGSRPTWASTTVGGLFFNLLAFSWAFTKNITTANAKLAVRGITGEGTGTGLRGLADRAAYLAPLTIGTGLLMLSAFATIGLKDALDDLILGDDEERARRRTEGWWVENIIRRSGGFMAADPLLQASQAGIYGREPITSLVGPTAGIWAELGSALNSLLVKNSPNTNAVERRTARAAWDTMVAPGLIMMIISSRVPGLIGAGAVMGLAGKAARNAFVDTTAGEEMARTRRRRIRQPQQGFFEQLAN